MGQVAYLARMPAAPIAPERIKGLQTGAALSSPRGCNEVRKSSGVGYVVGVLTTSSQPLPQPPLAV
jgi:hypothetical protein